MKLEKKFNDFHNLSRDDRIKLTRELRRQKPKFFNKFRPEWVLWRPCPVDVLIVLDGSLNFGITDFGISEFLTTFNELEAQYSVNYKVTLAHRGVIAEESPNPVVVQHIPLFKFDSSVSLGKFDQIWILGFSTSPISSDEISAVTNYIDGGGGVFATGDHGPLGSGMCANIPKLRDMRHWSNFPSNDRDDNEVSMLGRVRNDTNQPRPGDAVADTFDHQSDDLPQTIGVRIFDNGLPHPLLSISKNIRASGLIDIMPDHPHEGECKPEIEFTHNGVKILSQIIATSFVPGGNTAGFKDPTSPHCFPSIAVWNGREAGAGRLVIDSTWHHFVNTNLNGAGSPFSGLTSADFEVVQRYYMNISIWMARPENFSCLKVKAILELFKESQLVEAALHNPDQKRDNLSIADLISVGALAEQLLAGKFGAAMARELLLTGISETSDKFEKNLNRWSGIVDLDRKNAEVHHRWLNYDLLFHAAIGAGFIAMRDDAEISSDNPDEEILDSITGVFSEGMSYGYDRGLASLKTSIEQHQELFEQ